ncbi:HesA/MoeB/ThiF family protein [Sesbania bispinosa]|nr:HesA/MoeB/ThiF family protein [Sesbania bispinosa]
MVEGEYQGNLCVVTDGFICAEDPIVSGQRDHAIVSNNYQIDMLIPELGLVVESGPAKTKAQEVSRVICGGLNVHDIHMNLDNLGFISSGNVDQVAALDVDFGLQSDGSHVSKDVGLQRDGPRVTKDAGLCYGGKQEMLVKELGGNATCVEFGDKDARVDQVDHLEVDFGLHRGCWPEPSLARGFGRCGRKQEMMNASTKEFGGSATCIEVLNGEKEVLDSEQEGHLCEVPVLEVEDLEFLCSNHHDVQPKKRRGRSRKRVQAPTKVLGVCNPTNDSDVINKLMEMEIRDKDAIGRGVVRDN